FFIKLQPNEKLSSELDRFLQLLFGNPFKTPTQEEQAMFLAFASALRSGDLSRQVGAVVLSRGGDIIGVGANDVPRAGGGQYWPGEGDERDHAKGKDSNEKLKTELFRDAFAAFKAELRNVFGALSAPDKKALKLCDAALSKVDTSLLAKHDELKKLQ